MGLPMGAAALKELAAGLTNLNIAHNNSAQLKEGNGELELRICFDNLCTHPPLIMILP